MFAQEIATNGVIAARTKVIQSRSDVSTPGRVVVLVQVPQHAAYGAAVRREPLADKIGQLFTISSKTSSEFPLTGSFRSLLRTMSSRCCRHSAARSPVRASNSCRAPLFASSSAVSQSPISAASHGCRSGYSHSWQKRRTTAACAAAAILKW